MAPSKQTTERDVTRARVARDTALRSIKNLYALSLEAPNDIRKREVFLARYSTLERSRISFENEQQNVLTSLVELDRSDEFEKTDVDISEKMENLCGEIDVVFSKFSEKFQIKHDEPRNDSSESERSYVNRALALPKIELPKFDGNTVQWRSFRDMFTSIVHENRSISEIERFHFLISCLSGPALDIVKSVPMTADNYAIAWGALVNRFDNQRLLATAHVEKLFAFERLQRESVPALTSFINTFRENVAAIRAIGVDDLAGFLLFHIGARVLDSETRRLFETSVPQDNLPKLDTLLDFVTQRCRILENVGSYKIQAGNNNTGPKKSKGERTPGKFSLAAATSSKTIKCAFCDRAHLIYRCFSFKRKSVAERREYVMGKKLCFICLSADHLVGACQSIHMCKSCGGRHSTLLHVDTRNTASHNNDTEISVEKPTTSGTNVNRTSSPNFSGTTQSDIRVVLATAVVRIRDRTGEYVPIRTLLDTGSQISAMTSECVARLGLPRNKKRTDIVGLAQQPVTTVKGITKCTFIPAVTDLPKFEANNVIILPNITAPMPHAKLPRIVRDRYGHLSLADPDFDIPGSIEMLIGSDLYPFILQTRAEVVHSPGLPSALSTQLGWIIVGTMIDVHEAPMTSLSISTTPTIDELMNSFWAVEEPETPVSYNTEDEDCEKWFIDTVSRDSSGRFHVALPLRDVVRSVLAGTSGRKTTWDASSIGLGSSRFLALNRLYNLERRLNKDTELRQAYCDFMREYLKLGHMRLAKRSGEYFIPHHAVVKRDERGMKIRVVFDASARSSSGQSLNDCLLTGPKLQSDITEILLRNRFHKFIFVADIVKMYRQINIREEDRVFQHILWRESPEEEVQEYELCTITYGMSAAPFLAIRCLRQLEYDDGPEFPLARHLLIKSTYVDDIIAGADTVEDIVQLQQQVIALLERGCFELKKWASNCKTVLERVNNEDVAFHPFFEPTEGLAIKVLGLYWDPKEDTFGYQVNMSEVKATKRAILSTIARVYDPIGALGPTILWAKALMQQLWFAKLDWDTRAPADVVNKWEIFSAELPLLKHVTISRHIDIRQAKEVQLIGFSDASQRGYAATVYIRVVDHLGFISVHFLLCKSKVAPLKSGSLDTSLTIPRLELCAAVLLARLISRTLGVLQDVVHIDRIRAFSDSTIVLAWLRAEPKTFKIFVSNRICKIKELLPECDWAHVSSQENAADPASRGLLPGEMRSCNLHRNGPDFLRLLEQQWPKLGSPNLLPEDLPESKPVGHCSLHVQAPVQMYTSAEEILKSFSDLSRMERVVAYCFRFMDRARKRSIEYGPITHTEVKRGLRVAVKITQELHFSQLCEQLKNSSATVTSNVVAKLNPFLDNHGIIRVGGRLRFSALSEDAKYPILLPKRSHLTARIIWYYHLNTLHGGLRLVTSLIQRRFWIISSRDAIRQVIYSCVPCIRFKATNSQPFMSDLPSNRVQQCAPFANVGMDYGGPFVVKESRRRNARTHKAYLALFICMTVKAVHLEVVTDLSTESFLASFDRFIARRGIPTEIRSDCGTNYVGAARELKALCDKDVTKNAIQARAPCTWKFNPPAAPHFGGVWESAIKSVKTHLKKVIGTQVLTMEELTTLIVRVEGILNSRPLVPLSSDPRDLCALTPGHFLIGRPIMAIPEHDLSDQPMNRLNRWQLIKQAQQSFWHRWSHEYLQTLQSRQKWYTKNTNLEIGDLVIVNSPSRPSMAWQLGRIIAVHPGPDEIVRVVTLKTAEGELKRPVVKVVKLPIS